MVQRTIDLLPEIFRTDTNKKFLSATLDQLTQEVNLKRTQGYIGRRTGPGVNPANNYVVEPTKTRTDYQLETGVVFFKPDTNTAVDAITYPGIIDALNLQGANTTLQDRLFESQYYSWDPFCDLDKFSNYSQYYWLSQGPDSVNVSTTDVPITYSWDVSYVVDNGDSYYNFSDVLGNNPTLTLVRGGSYTFNVNQPGHNFWIQAAPGVSGRLPQTPNISSRDVFGVVNNGINGGTVTFNVPLKTAQDFYYTLNSIGTVDLLTDLTFEELNNVYVDDFLAQNPTGIDGITNLDNRTVVFQQTSSGWTINSQFSPLVGIPDNNGLLGSYDTTSYDQATPITDPTTRYSVWRIQYITDGDRPYMRLTSILDVPALNKFQITFGTQWSSTQWYKNAEGYFEEIPLLTAALDTLYYQDGSDSEAFGKIRLIDSQAVDPIVIDDIIGAKNYTSPNGVVFTNGLKVQFRGLAEPAQFQELEFYVEGVGTGPGSQFIVGYIDGEAYFGPFHVYQGRKMTGSVHSEDTFQQYIYNTVGDSLVNFGAGAPEGAPLPTTPIGGATIGNGIKLIPVSDFITPETYTESVDVPYDTLPYDTTGFAADLNSPLVPDYITINRASLDKNAWSRSNRWFHIDVINATATYNNTVAVLDNNFRAKRPIIEFRANLELYNFGTQGKQPVDIIDFNETDAFSNINGQLGYGIDGYQFINGTIVIFAADVDPMVRDQVYEVRFVDPSNTGTLIIDLVPIFNSKIQFSQTVVCLNGTTLTGKSFWFDGVEWQTAQQKTSVNQAPLFNVRNAQGTSYDNLVAYPSSTFRGSKLFGYALGGTSRSDDVLGFALKYLNINNIGDIVFDNFLYTDTFIYVKNSVSSTQPISEGFVRQYIDRTGFSNLIGWQKAAGENRSRQVFKFVYDGISLIFDVPPATNTVYPVLQIYVGSEFVDPTTYIVTSTSESTTVTFINSPEVGSIIEAQLISDVASNVAYYQVPLNLEDNPLNQNSNSFTLGTIRNHYNSIGQNLKNISGPINGANNSRDLGDIIRYGDLIVQQSAPLTLTGTFLRKQQYELFNSLRFNSQEYEKYKALLLDLASKGDFVNNTPTQILDDILLQIATGKSNLSPFYWSDMIPANETYIENTYTYSPISTPTFDTQQVYNFTSSNYLGLLVFLNGTLLVKNYDYTVGVDSPTVTITVSLAVDDTIVIREYSSTYGSYVPNTPTKMGLYPAYKPEIFVDKTSVNNALVIQGHDGSITRAFDDFRDQVLLEFETRIYDNLKINSPIPLIMEEVIPGQFRTTDYTLTEINNILSEDFLTWVGWNKLDYNLQSYVPGNEFTYNYSQSGNRLNGQPLLGAWRGIYNYSYDTYMPNTRPWEMLGFSEEPSWWQDEYGPAPYTSGNLVLWEDLANGIVRDPAGIYVNPLYIRPGLTDIIPSGSEGELLSPLNAIVGNFDSTSFRRSWVFGDDGPVENTWRTSSSWPFAVMRLLALTKPAKFFSLFADRDRYKFDATLDQYLWDGRYRLDAKNMSPLYGNDVSKASYINWIIDYNRVLGNNSTTDLTIALSNVGVRLCWRLAAFSDKNYLKIYTERSTPNSLNTSLLLPDESYQILLYKNQPFSDVSYSSVIVQKVEGGYTVLGYSTTKPYFEILASRVAGLSTVITVGNESVRVPVEYTNDIVQIPYGYVFRNETAICDFLLSYGKYLEEQGLVFEVRENGYVLNWYQMAQEFLYWEQQGWSIGSMINLNPAATKLSVTKPFAVADSIATPSPGNIILNQNRQAISPGDLVIDRLENTFILNSLTNNAICFADLKFTSYEHIIIFDNVSIFADLIYDPTTGARQSRVLVSGWLSGDWNGLVNAPGFVLNQDNIVEWIPNKKYTKGEIVQFKNEYWSALSIIQPSQDFDYNLWVKSDYREIQTGLLPNSPNSSDQLATAYSVYNANLETEIDLFSYGLIGFRQREYMKALNLDDVSQVGLYQQFLGTKGTTRSAELFTFANLGKETAQYDIYEYWAMLRSQYGATANRRYFELLLNEADLTSDPSLIQVIEPGQSSDADQIILVDNIWKISYTPDGNNLLPTVDAPLTDDALPNAGYVNFQDVDFTSFDFTSQTINDNLSSIGVGTLIWVAKVNAYDWGVFRCQRVPGAIITIIDNLDQRSVVTFDTPHGLVPGNLAIIKYFDPAINGTYIVQSVPSLTTLIIGYEFTASQNTTIVGDGLALTLSSARVNQAADIATLEYAKSIPPGAKVWVDNNGSGNWTVLEKTDPFVPFTRLSGVPLDAGQHFGSAISQGVRNLIAMVGAPGYNSSAGGIYNYVKISDNQYSQTGDAQQLLTPNASGYGNAVDIGNKTWAVAGASTSNNNQGYAVTIYNPEGSNEFLQTQLLVAADQDFGPYNFGHAVTISQDERWLYVGAPGVNKVYAYNRVDVEIQGVVLTTNGTSNQYSFAGEIVYDNLNNSDQIVVSLDNTELTVGVDYSLNATNDTITLGSIPSQGLILKISRRSSVVFTGTGGAVSFNIIDYLYTADNIFSFSVEVNGALYRPFIDYDINFDSSLSSPLVFHNPATYPALGASIRVTSTTYWDYIEVLSVAGLSSTAKFGINFSTTTDGRQLLVGAPGATQVNGSETISDAGAVYLIDRSVQTFVVTDTTVLSYTTEQTIVGPATVIVNGQFLQNSDNFLNGQFTVAGNTITLDSSIQLTIGDLITVETNNFKLVQEVDAAQVATNSNFGFAVDQCINNCSLYVGAPNDSQVLPRAGRVEYFQNQSRVYGTITSLIANPVLTPGESIRVNNVFVEVPTPTAWSSLVAWPTNSFVTTGGSIFRSLRAVPAGAVITDQTYWKPSGWAELLANAINNSNAPNANATMLPDSEGIASGLDTTFSIGEIYSSAQSYTPVVFVNNILQTLNVDYTYNNSAGTITFATAPLGDSVILVINGRMTISTINFAASTVLNRLQVMPGVGSSATDLGPFGDLGFEVYVNQQVMRAPYSQSYANFGYSVFISDNTTSLLIGAPYGTILEYNAFDNGSTVFDSNSTIFFNDIPSSGVAYLYDFLPAANTTVNNPGQFVFGQQIYDSNVTSNSRFGYALDLTTGTLLIGAPYDNINGAAGSEYGQIARFENVNQLPAWEVIRKQTPVVAEPLLNTAFLYDRVSGAAKQYLDHFDPLQGRILGAVRQNIDYIGAVDPAAYNVGLINNFGMRWAQERVGQIWWDTQNVRFIDPNQDDVVYASRRWGQVFPGSTIDVYQWIDSEVAPVDYIGPGVPLSTTSYTVTSSVNDQGLFVTTYFFWVEGITTVDRTAQKTLSTTTIARYIESPRSSGIAYMAPINSSTIAIYNCSPYISSQDTVIHVEFDQTANEDAIHVEYQLIPQDRKDGFLSAELYLKLQDSFCGSDLLGSPVPDPFLSPSEKYGVLLRPRQSMFVNRFLALQNYLTRTNQVLTLYPVADIRRFELLNSSDPEPTASSGAWNKRVANIEELSYQDLALVSLGYKYLVVSDSTENGLWTIYEVVAGALIGSKDFQLVRVQTYDTRLYWQYIDWYLPGYNPLTRIVTTVPTYSALSTITVPNGSSVKVTANAQGKFEIYQLDGTNWIRVGLQDGTIKFLPELWDYTIGRFGYDVEVFDAQYFDQEPVTETRKIIQAINQELFIDDLALERNRLLVLMFNYILTEQQAPLWLTKTSLIDVDHTIRELVPFQIYRQDNQDFVLNYIQEVKPYHVQIREFNLIYNGSDTYQGTVTDFDLPAYWDSAENLFVSPVLDDTGTLSTTSSVPSTSPIWQTLPWNQWYQNYLLDVQDIIIIDGGSGYIDAPEVVVTGDCISPAIIQSRINSAGVVTSLTILDSGQGYSTTAILTLTASPAGTTARAATVMGNNLVRSVTTTIKYDRYQYQTDIVTWEANVTYTQGTMVRYSNKVWEANQSTTESSFDPQQWTFVPANDLSGVNRTMGYYTPRVNEPGLDLALLISGVDYPGVQVSGPGFDQNTGFDVGGFDDLPFDNISYGPEGRPTYDPAILDAIYESNFVDPYLGIGPAAIDVSGGEFVDVYSSHAPEELVPGAIFDTLDMRVFTTPGSDWIGNGHGFNIESVSYEFSVSGSTYSFADILEFTAAVKVYNVTVGVELAQGIDYTVDWVNQIITVNSGASTGNIIIINCYEIGGGNQLYRNRFLGEVVGSTIVVPMPYSLIEDVVIFVNGVQVTNFTDSEYSSGFTQIVFASALTSSDAAIVTLLGAGVDSTVYSWSLPITQYFISSGELTYQLTNYVGGTNPANAIIEKNGIRARPSQGVEYIADGSSLQYYLPANGGYSQGLIADNDVFVWINNESQTLGVDFIVDPWDGYSDRTITFSSMPGAGSQILISVRTAAQAYITGDILYWRATGGLIPLPGDIISVTTWNDTDEQNLLTQIFVGPTTQGVTISETYDSTLFDEATVSNTPGSYDFTIGQLIQTNTFDTGVVITDPNRVIVTLNGFYKFNNQGFTVSGSKITLIGPVINATDIVAITTFTQSVVPGSIAFRIFQDMRGLQSTYRITDNTTTTLAQGLSAVDGIIYVTDASKLSEPNLEQGIFGLITIDGERIAYRTRDLVTNTLGGLRRGTAGTAAANHSATTPVYDIGIGNLLPKEYQNKIIADNFLGDGTTSIFTAENISINMALDEAVEVYVGGILQVSGYSITNSSPVTVEFDQPPEDGYQVSIRILQGLSWYQPGPSTPSDGVALQETNTDAARFIRGGM